VPKEGGFKIDLLMEYFNPETLVSIFSLVGMIEIVCPVNESILVSLFTHLILDELE
jgi:hypothetical protein